MIDDMDIHIATLVYIKLEFAQENRDHNKK